MSLSTLNAAESTASSSSNSISSTSHDSATTSPFKSPLAPVLHPPTPARSSNPSSSACSSAHPSPNGTLTRSPSMDAMTPRSLKQYSADELGSAALGVPSPSPSSPSLTREPADSPFFAGWERDSRTHTDSGSPQGHTNDLTSSPDQKRYSLSSSLATSSTTPLYASATSPLFASTALDLSSSSRLQPTLPKLQVLSAPSPTPPSGWPSPMSPLPMDAVPPSAPKIGMLATPIMSPQGSLPTTPMASYLRSLSPLQQTEVAENSGLSESSSPNIQSLLDIQGKRPLPGSMEDEDITISSAMLSQAMRSDSANSISSVLNDTGHDTSPPLESERPAPDTLYNGSAFIHDINAPPLHALPMPVQVERALPILPTQQHGSDPPLIPSLRRPDLMHLAGESSTSTSPRPISPFSPTLPLASEDTRLPVSIEFDDTRPNIAGTERDLINFDSDSDSALPDMYDQYAHYRDIQGDSVYLARHYSTQSFRQQEERESISSSDEDEEGDAYSKHDLYNTLSTSQSPYVRRAWEGSRVVLVPCKHTLPHSFLTSSKQWNANTSLERPEIWERFAAIHALRQETGSPDYVGFGETSDGFRLHARLDSENRQVQISLKQELDSSSIPSLENGLNEFGMVQQPTSQFLSRHTFSSSTASDQSSTIPPHLLVSSPSTSVESGNFPDTPPLSSTMSPSVPSRISSGSGSAAGSTPRIPQVIAFPSIEQSANSYGKTPLSPTRRLNIVHEKVIYRKRRLRSNVSNSAPSALPSPPPAMSRNESTMSNTSNAAASVQVNSIQQATDRLSKLSTPSMQSISSLASVATNNGKSVKKKDSKVRLRVPKWLGGRNRDSISGLKITESAPSTPIQPQLETKQPTPTEEVQLVIEKVRLIQVDSYIVEWPGEATITSPTRDYTRPSSLLARQSQQNLTARMHRKLSQPLSASSLSLQDATVKERRSFQHPPFSATLVEEAADIPGIASVQMGSRHNSNASHSSRVSKRSSNALRMKHTSQASSTPGAIRDFSSDIAYLLDPPKYLEHFSGLFEQSLKMIIRSSKDFAERFYYIRTQEQEAVERLRIQVLEQVWQYFADEEAIHGLRHHLLDIFENAIMAFAHDYVYSKTISPSFSHQEGDFGNLINTYRIHAIQIADFGISSRHYSEPAFAPVVDTLSELCGSGARRQELWEKMPPQSYKRLVQLISQTTDSATTVIALLEARTPLDTIAHLRKAIDGLVKATSSSDSGHEESYSRLATDDLIPLLSWALVKANAKTLPSLLFYAKMFRLSAHTHADSEWTIVQFEAAMAYLSTDPLRLQKSASMSSPMQSQSVSPVQPMFLRTVSEDSLGLPGRSRRSSVQSLPPESARTISRSPSQQTHLASYHKRTLSSLPSTRMALYQAAGRPSSIVSAVTTEEDEDNVEMGPPAPPRKGSVCGSADSHDLLSASTFSTGRERSTSPPIHRPVAVRPPRRPFHLSHDQMRNTSQITRIPLARSQTTPLNNTIRPPSFPNQRTSAELSRTGSDASRRGPGDWWGPLRQAIATGPASPPVGSEGTQSSRPDSPASPAVKSIDRYSSARSSFDLERSSSDMGWMEWGRKRLSSMTSSTSLVESAEGGRTVAEQIAEKLAASAARAGGVPTANRNRRASESAASMLSPNQFEEAASEIQAIATPSIAEPSSMTSLNSRSLSSARSRPRSTLSLSSTSSLDTDASLSRSTNTASASLAARSQFRNSIAGPSSGYGAHSSNLSRSRRFRKELRSANLAPSMALPQLQLDTASASASSSSSNMGSGNFSYSHRSTSSMHSDMGSGSSFGNPAFYHSHSLSQSTSRLGTTPFSPIQEAAPSLQGYPSSPEQVLSIKTASNDANSDDSVPPTPRDVKSAERPWSQPTLSS